MNNINRLFNVVNHNLATINGAMDYDRITDSIIVLANTVHNYPGEIDWSWEFGAFSLDSLIVGAYWHYTHWHGGQYSKTYAALCALGQVYSPGMECGPEEDSLEYSVYELLSNLIDEEGITDE